MRKAILCFVFFVFASCSTSQVENKWASLTYMFEAGPLPPKYQYSYNITINRGLDGTMVGFLGTDPATPSLVYNFKVTDENIKALDDAINKSKILEGNIEELPEGVRPVGGHLEKVRIVMEMTDPNLDQAPRVKESPYYPADKYVKGLRDLYSLITSFVPQSTWDDFNKKKEEFQKSGE